MAQDPKTLIWLDMEMTGLEHDRDRIFEPFFRGERQPEDAVRGTGIGLSIVHEYIGAHGGRVQLLPARNGAHFRIELPHAS